MPLILHPLLLCPFYPLTESQRSVIRCLRSYRRVWLGLALHDANQNYMSLNTPGMIPEQSLAKTLRTPTCGPLKKRKVTN